MLQRLVAIARLLAAAVAILVILGFSVARADHSSWRPPRYALPANQVVLSDRGVQPNTGQDVAARLNAVLSTLRPGQTLLLAAGTYKVGTTLLIPSGVSLQGPQDENGLPLATLMQVKRFPDWGPLRRGLLMNEHYDAPQIVDRDITITSVAFEDESTGILFRMVASVVVRGSRFNGGGDGTAFLASRDTLVIHCLATNTTNAAYDHWDGDQNATVSDSVAAVANGYGILFNAIDTDNAERTARDFSAIGNVITGVGRNAAGIWVSPLGKGTSKIAGDISVVDNVIRDPRRDERSGGILIDAADADTVLVQGNSVAGFHGYVPLRVTGRPPGGQANSPSVPGRTLVIRNVFSDNRVPRGAHAILPLEGKLLIVAYNRLEQNAFEDGGAAPALPSSAREAYVFGNTFVGEPGINKQAGLSVAERSAAPSRDATRGVVPFATPCAVGRVCAYAQPEVNRAPLVLTCARGRLSVADATWGQRECTRYVAHACDGRRACVIMFGLDACGGDPETGTKKGGAVRASCHG
jgi:hypothetical protein